MEKAKEICIEMINQRGYNVEEDQGYYLAINNEDEEDQFVIFFCIEPKFNIKQLLHYISKTNEMGFSHCLIVHAEQITAAAKKGLDNLEMEIELFSQKELQYNITQHILVPHHERLGIEESQKIKKKYGSNLPTILKTDPVSRFYNFKKGDVIKITRKEGYIIYRLVK